MTSGRDMLAILDSTLQQARVQIQDFETRSEQSSEQLAALRQRESALYRELAKLRINDIRLQQFHDTLDQAERQAQSLLEERNNAIAELAVRSRESQQHQTQLEDERQAQAKKLEQATLALAEKLDEVHAALETHSDYRAQQEKTQQAVDTLSAADEKTQQAEHDRQEKGKPFRDDALFMYLWNRHYGTSDYHANLVARFFDRLLAQHIRYEASRQNYHRLLEIPKRLREHTDILKAAAEAEMDILSSMEQEAEQAAGIDTFEATVAAEKAALDALDKAIEEAVGQYQALLTEHEQFTAGEDPLFQQAIKTLVANFRAEPIPELRRDAAMTEGYEDDSLVSELATLRHRKNALQEIISEYRDAHQQQILRLQALADLRRRFKQSGYDAANSRFTDAASIEMLLREFRHGQITSARLWRALERAQRFVRYARQPTIGSIGFPRGLRLPGGLRLPSGTGRLPRGIRFPGGFGGGGLGGSSGGGGFRTGGGF